jgi:hypothetical protein
MEGGVWKLTSEASKVVSRKVSRLPPNEPPTERPLYSLDPSGTAIIALSNLFPDNECYPERTSGKIVKRHFRENGLTLSGFVIEGKDGTREFVNVTVDVEKLDAVTRSWVTRGLQILLVEGRSAEITVKACGAAGRVSMLDAVR